MTLPRITGSVESWTVLFAKAFALAARTHAPLRRAYVARPWPRLYEHPFSIASFAVERSFAGEPAVFFAKVRAPEQQTLSALDEHLRRFTETLTSPAAAELGRVRNFAHSDPAAFGGPGRRRVDRQSVDRFRRRQLQAPGDGHGLQRLDRLFQLRRGLHGGVGG